MPTTYGYFEPRIGIAWQVYPTTVVRAGFGMFTTPLEDAFYNHVWDTAPFAPSYNLSGGSTTPLSFDNPWSSFARREVKSPFPPFASPSQIPSSNTTFITPLAVPAVFAQNFKLGITQSWNLSLEQSFGSQFVLHMAYVGAESFHQATTVDQNPGGFVCPTGVAVNPTNCTDVRSTYTNFSRSFRFSRRLHRAITRFRSGSKTLSHSIQFQSNFTWSHDTDVGGSGDPSFESSVSDPHNVGHDRGPSSRTILSSRSPILSIRFPLLGSPERIGKESVGWVGDLRPLYRAVWIAPSRQRRRRATTTPDFWWTRIVLTRFPGSLSVFGRAVRVIRLTTIKCRPPSRTMRMAPQETRKSSRSRKLQISLLRISQYQELDRLRTLQAAVPRRSVQRPESPKLRPAGFKPRRLELWADHRNWRSTTTRHARGFEVFILICMDLLSIERNAGLFVPVRTIKLVPKVAGE